MFTEIPELINILGESGISRVVLLTLMMRESAIDNAVEAPTDYEFRLMCDRLRDAEPLVEVTLNDYGQQEDRYVVLESDGEVLLCSDNQDVSFGFILRSSVNEPLSAALNAQLLAHRRTVTGAANA